MKKNYKKNLLTNDFTTITIDNHPVSRSGDNPKRLRWRISISTTKNLRKGTSVTATQSYPVMNAQELVWVLNNLNFN
jgi:hypothetical protein